MGGLVMVLLGHVRSGKATGLNAAYFWLGCFNIGMMRL